LARNSLLLGISVLAGTAALAGVGGGLFLMWRMWQQSEVPPAASAPPPAKTTTPVPVFDPNAKPLFPLPVEPAAPEPAREEAAAAEPPAAPPPPVVRTARVPPTAAGQPNQPGRGRRPFQRPGQTTPPSGQRPHGSRTTPR
jgi:hypothetical protein